MVPVSSQIYIGERKALPMRRFLIAGVLAIVTTATVNAQAILEYGAAAAGGSAAGVAGKRVSDSLDKVMNKVTDLTKSTPTNDNKPRKLAPAVPPVPEVRLKDLNLPQDAAAKAKTRAAQPGRRQANLRTPAAQQPDPVAAPVAEPAIPTPPPPPAATVDDLKSLDGASREDVLTKMGKPASRITISDERGLVETYSFKNSNGNLGSVRIINGTVSEVRPVQ
jgi:hypothetical protein